MATSGTLDSILNIAIPILLVLVVGGFVWIRFVEPWGMPLLRKMWAGMTGANLVKKNRVIEYE